jgi:hypothetical protein
MGTLSDSSKEFESWTPTKTRFALSRDRSGQNSSLARHERFIFSSETKKAL